MSDLSANEGEQELTGDNVFHWKQMIKAKLLQHDCWSVVGDDADLTGSDNDWDMTIPQQVRERTQLNRKRKKKAMGLILKSVGSYISAEISDAKSARTMYRKGGCDANQPEHQVDTAGKIDERLVQGYNSSRDECLDAKQGGHPFYFQGYESASSGRDCADLDSCWPSCGVSALYQGFWNKT